MAVARRRFADVIRVRAGPRRSGPLGQRASWMTRWADQLAVVPGRGVLGAWRTAGSGNISSQWEVVVMEGRERTEPEGEGRPHKEDRRPQDPDAGPAETQRRDPRGDVGRGHDQDPEHPDEQADLRERAPGAHAEQVSDEANLRADTTAPGVSPREHDSGDRGSEDGTERPRGPGSSE